MAIIQDLIEKLYILDSSHWHNELSDLFCLMGLPVKSIYVCNHKEFLYEKTNLYRSSNSNAKNILKSCDEIASYKIIGGSSNLACFAIKISGNKKLRNEKVADITRAFEALYGKHMLLCFIYDKEIAFSGIYINQKHYEVIISEWFSCFSDIEKANQFEEIYLEGSYYEYLCSIARPYVKTFESKMYYIYGYNNPITYEKDVHNEYTDESYIVEVIDTEATLEYNRSYYYKKYGFDYYIDDSTHEVDSDYFHLDEDNLDFEWTMLELEIIEETNYKSDNELFNDNNDNVYTNDNNDNVYSKDNNRTIDKMNPFEMLNYIRKSQ